MKELMYDYVGEIKNLYRLQKINNNNNNNNNNSNNGKECISTEGKSCKL